MSHAKVNIWLRQRHDAEHLLHAFLPKGAPLGAKFFGQESKLHAFAKACLEGK